MGLFGKTPERNPKEMVSKMWHDLNLGKFKDLNSFSGNRMEPQITKRRIPTRATNTM